MKKDDTFFRSVWTGTLFVCLAAGGAWAADSTPLPPAATFEAATGRLSVTFGDANDLARFTFDFTSNLIQLQQDWSNAMTPGPYLLVNGGQTVSQLEVKEMIINLSAGDDNLLEPILSVPALKIHAGPGSDVIKTPAGKKIVYVYGGPGDDTINAEHSWTNFLYGEDGDDKIFGSSDGANYLDGGSGTNYLYTFKDTWDPSVIQTIVYHEGSINSVYDSSGPNVYKFVSSGSAPPLNGSMTIYEYTDQGYDTLDFSSWNHAVRALDLASTNPQVVSVDGNGNSFMTLQMVYANRIEKVVYPAANQPPQIVSAPWANPNPITLPATTTVSVVASDPDNGPAALTYTWSLVSGPGTVTFSPNGTAASATSTATFGAAGNYVLRASTSDGAAPTSGDLAVVVNPQPAEKTMRVSGIAMSLTTNRSGTFASAKVRIVDQNGAAVAGAVVTGSWSGLVSGPASGTTSTGGAVTFKSPKTKNSGTFTFTITNVSLSGYTYAPAANLQTSNSITKTVLAAAQGTEEAPPLAADGTDLTGTLLVLVADDLEQGKQEVSYWLETAQAHGRKERLELEFLEDPPALSLSGATVRAKGRQSPGRLTLSSGEEASSLEILSTSVPLTAGNVRTIALVVNLSDVKATWSPDKINTLLFGTSGSVDQYYRESSFGAVSFTGSVAGPYTINYSSTGSGYTLYAWSLAADQAALAAGVDVTLYDRKIYVLPRLSVGWAGTAFIGGKEVYINGNFWDKHAVYSHELGHTLGMYHASTAPPLGTAEYGDGTCIMGQSASTAQVHANAPHKVQMGWVPPERVQTVSQTGSYSISLLEQAGSAVQVLKILKPDTYEYYYLSYRQQVGFDSSLYSGYVNRTSVHRWGGGNTYLLGFLADGQTFSDAANGITFTQTAHAGGSATVSVQFTKNQAPPTVTISPASQGSWSGQTLNYTVTVKNNDVAYPSTTFNLTPAAPAGWTATLAPSSLTLASNATGTATLSVTSPAGTLDGNYPLAIQVSDGPLPVHNASGTAAFVVDSVPPSAPMNLSATVSRKNVTLSWTAAQDNLGVAGYSIYRDGVVVAQTAGTSTGYVGYTPRGTHTFLVQAFDTAKNTSPLSSSVTVSVK